MHYSIANKIKFKQGVSTSMSDTSYRLPQQCKCAYHLTINKLNYIFWWGRQNST